MARFQSGQIPSRQPTRWKDFEEDRTKREKNPELTEPRVDTILRGQNVTWPGSREDRIQVDKHPGGTECKVDMISNRKSPL